MNTQNSLIASAKPVRTLRNDVKSITVDGVRTAALTASPESHIYIFELSVEIDSVNGNNSAPLSLVAESGLDLLRQIEAYFCDAAVTGIGTHAIKVTSKNLFGEEDGEANSHILVRDASSQWRSVSASAIESGDPGRIFSGSDRLLDVLGSDSKVAIWPQTILLTGDIIEFVKIGKGK